MSAGTFDECVLADATAAGFDVRHISDIAHQFKRVPQPIVESILRHLPIIDDDAVAADASMYLQHPERPFDGRPLAALFERTSKLSFRLQIGLAFEMSAPTDIVDWLERTIADTSYGMARIPLFPAYAKLVPADDALVFLKPFAVECPTGAALAWALCGREAELAWLEGELAACKRGHASPSSISRDELKKAIGKLKTRLKRIEMRAANQRLAPGLAPHGITGLEPMLSDHRAGL